MTSIKTCQISSEKIEELNSLKSKRQYIRQKISRKCNSLETRLIELSHSQCEENLSSLSRMSEDLSLLDNSIGNLVYELEGETGLNIELEGAEQYERKNM